MGGAGVVAYLNVATVCILMWVVMKFRVFLQRIILIILTGL
jgi:hypothetical protein